MIYFEFMQCMKNTDDFPKALYISQGLGTTLYLVAGVGVYGMVGDATWLASPINTTFKGGAVKYALQIMIVIHISIVAIITGTFVIRAIQRNLEPPLRVRAAFYPTMHAHTPTH